MEEQKILKFMGDLDQFIKDTQNKVPTKEKKVSMDFINVIESLILIDEEFNLNNMDLAKHLIFHEDGSFSLSEQLKQSILKN